MLACCIANIAYKSSTQQKLHSSNNAGYIIRFSMSNLSYDGNRNILTMNQKGFKVNGSALIDQLSYTYQTNSNKLTPKTVK